MPLQPLLDVGHQLGDVDGDGDLDRFETSAGSIRLSLNDGDGDLLAPVQMSVPSIAAISRAVLADLDGDGDLDCVARGGETPASGVLVVALWSAPTGPFVESGTAPLAPQTHPEYTYLAAGDLDGDGDDEVVSVLTEASGVWTLTPWDWDGAQLVPGPSQSFGSFLNTFGVPLICGDLTGDGRADVVVAALEASQSKALVFTSNAGQLLAPVATGLGAFVSTELHLGDREGDGDLDVLSASAGPQGFGSALQWLRNDGSGSLQLTPASFFGELDGLVVATGDWDGDGDSDAVGPRGMFENLGGSFAVAASVPTLNAPVAVADASGDGLADYLAAGRLMVGDGTFDLGPDAFLDHVDRAFDLDGDGDLDLLAPGFDQAVYAGDLALLENDASAEFAPADPSFPGLAPNEQFTAAVGPADFDGDGRLEFVCNVGATPHPFIPPAFVRRVLLRQTAPGTWTEDPAATSTVPLPLVAQEEGLLDVDGDGRLDLLQALLGAFQLPTIYWSAGDGAGGFGPIQAIADAYLQEVVDVDGDGLADLVTRGTNGTPSALFSLLRNQGGGRFASELLISATTVDLVDLDGDGDPDLVARRIETGGADLLVGRLNQGGSFGAEQLLATGAACPSTSFGSEYYAADVDGDGTLDLLNPSVASVDGTLGVYRGIPTASPLGFEPQRCFAVPYTRLVADLDADGDVDLAGQHLYLGRTVQGATAPLTEQYGSGATGTGGWTPLLGYDGVPVVGETVTTRLVNGTGGAPAFYFYGTSAALLADFPAPGLTVLIGDFFPPIVQVLSGSLGAPGAGQFQFPFSVPPSFAGFELFKQVLVVDPAGPGGLTLSNALRVRYGQ
ncbi:FG-GAP repeat domain-containing protein [Engelhardtia mirabilis]|uniref:FG-GAP repeat domain-containing protein n=1 Tax=Engelhardtia mirabilis TaxID=2528011 RepID=UPI003AF3E77E